MDRESTQEWVSKSFPSRGVDGGSGKGSALLSQENRYGGITGLNHFEGKGMKRVSEAHEASGTSAARNKAESSRKLHAKASWFRDSVEEA